MRVSLAPVLLVAIILLSLAVTPLRSQEQWKDVQYTSGISTKPNAIQGTLRIADTDVQLVDGHGQLEIDIPLNMITDVNISATRHDASIGKKLLFGAFAGSKVDEYVNIFCQSSEGPQVIIFKVKENKSLEISTRIQYRAKKESAVLENTGTSSAPGA